MQHLAERVARLERQASHMRGAVIAGWLVAGGVLACTCAPAQPTEIVIGGARLDDKGLTITRGDRRTEIQAGQIQVDAVEPGKPDRTAALSPGQLQLGDPRGLATLATDSLNLSSAKHQFIQLANF